MRALSKDRDQRQTDAIAFDRELQNALTAPTGYQPRPLTTPTRQKPWKWILVATGVLFALLLVVGAGFAIKFGMDQFGSNRSEVEQTTGDLTGTWTGTYGPLSYATKLVIKDHSGDKFEGTLEQGAIRVAFTGSYNSATRELTMKQTAVLSGDGWSLGEDSGKISTDGKMISGTGQDPLGGALGIRYQWSFTRE